MPVIRRASGGAGGASAGMRPLEAFACSVAGPSAEFVFGLCLLALAFVMHGFPRWVLIVVVVGVLLNGLLTLVPRQWAGCRTTAGGL